MKHKKIIEVPATTRAIVEKTTCDLCGIDIRDTSINIDDVTIHHKKGYSYPEGGAGEETNVDMCGKCFTEKLIPWLKSNGAVPVTEEWDF